MRVDGPWCGDIAAAAIVHLALTAPPELLVSSADLREPLALSPALGGVEHVAPGQIAPPAGAGLGILLDPTALDSPDWRFSWSAI